MDQLTESEGGEEKDEGRVGVQSNNRPKHHKQPLAAEGGNLDRAREKGGGLYSLDVFLLRGCDFREAAGRVGVPKQR